jgi:hypothetical protein
LDEAMDDRNYGYITKPGKNKIIDRISSLKTIHSSVDDLRPEDIAKRDNYMKVNIYSE